MKETNLNQARIKYCTPCMICEEPIDLPEGCTHAEHPQICEKCKDAVKLVRRGLECTTEIIKARGRYG